ncbi:MAG TPA: DUF6351 family protein [Caulobacteraceae bacterium]|jgi:feruloyl esterase|nr:DUF6351 family protein [Caulobacteraceae bacterium]
MAARSASIAVTLAASLGLAGRAAAKDCASLAGASFAGAQVVSAVEAAGAVDKASGELPAFCRIAGVTAGTERFEVWAPKSGWNGRLLSVGSGGFGGSIQTAAMADGLRRGFAVTSNDTGHQGEARAWMRNREQVRLWGHSATHLATGPAKAIVAAYYGAPARYAYFSGCSTGGAQAMEEAQFYPDDYDGVIAGAPGMSYAHLMLSFLWGLKAASAHPDSLLTPQKLLVLHAAVLARCDAADSVADGLISDPEACRFDPAVLLCKGADGPDCLTAHQVETARLIYQGARNPRTGAVIYPGMAPGSEAETGVLATNPYGYGWSAIQGPLASIFAIPLLKEMAFGDPNWDWRSFDWDRDVTRLDALVGSDITALDPDLRAFRAHGGKLIMYQGWGDPLNGQTLPIRYRQQVIDRFAAEGAGRARAERRVDGFFRLFMAPGMSHCEGGPGPSRFDALAAMQGWVETGVAPERLIAQRVATPGRAAQPPMTRPLCAWPKVARWSGQGSTNEAANFACVREPRTAT